MALTIIYPQLDGVKVNQDRTLPVSVLQAIRKAYDYITDLSKSAAAGIVVIEDLHVNRILYPASHFTIGSMYLETDTLLTYIVKTVNAAKTWCYYTGTYERTQTQLAAVASGLGTNDTNLLVDVTDYAHILRWTGAAWTYADPSDPAGRIEGFLVDPDPVTGWHLCDGASVSYLKKDGTLGSKTLDDLTSAAPKAAYMKFGGTVAAVVASVAPTLTMNSYTPAGTVSVGTFSGSGGTTGSTSGGTPAGTNSAPTFTFVGFTATNDTFQPLPLGTPALTGITSVTGTVSAPTFTGSALAGHTHTITASGTIGAQTFTGTPATLTGTISATAEPRQFTLRPYFRL